MSILEKREDKMLAIGPAIEPYLDTLATLRLEIFQEYPYLYRGSLENELSYLRTYTKSPEAIVITVDSDGSVAGAVTAMPLKDEMEELVSPFAVTPYAVDQIFYIGEVLFYPQYRNHGLGTKLLAKVEEYVRSLGIYHYLTCATVVRPESHPDRPADYVAIDRFLDRNGYTRVAGVTTTFSWQELDGISQDHPMQFWMKSLSLLLP